ncbi:MAG: hypothetical protein ACTSXJ_11305 [Candidatus Baldrarchaeia archaeon]
MEIGHTNLSVMPPDVAESAVVSIKAIDEAYIGSILETFPIGMCSGTLRSTTRGAETYSVAFVALMHL